MTSIVNALDKHIDNKTFGENGHAEYAWSEEPSKLITQFFFQLVRCKKNDMLDLENKLRYLLNNLSRDSEMFTLLYKIIAQTRDIVEGKGEYELSFMQLRVWYDYYPSLAINAFSLFVNYKNNPLSHQYGSWKDVKYMCNHIKQNTIQGENHPFIKNILDNVAEELVSEWQLLRENAEKGTTHSIKLLGRWIPREKSKKFGWIFKALASIVFSDYTQRPQDGWKSRDQMLSAVKKQRTHLKNMITALSKETDTAQIKMCANKWSELNFNKITSITLRKQKNAILNVNKNGKVRHPDNHDRVSCAQNYKSHLQKAVSGDSTAKIHGKRCTVGELVKDALALRSTSGPMYDTINQQWISNTENNKALKDAPIVSMVDTSGSMEVDDSTPLYNAVGLGVRTSELCHSAFKNRVLTFNSVPCWVRFNETDTPVDKIKKCRSISWGTSTNLSLAVDTILDALVKADVNPDSVRNLILAVFSDMQFDCNYVNGTDMFDTADKTIAKKFAMAGLTTSHGRPYDPPHLLFWNLRKTNGFPSTTFSKNITYLGGYNSALLNIFCDQGLEALRECASPYSQLVNLLSNERYSHMESFLQ